MTNAMAEVDDLGEQPPITTILFPLLGAGQGGGDLKATITALTGSAIDYFASVPETSITTAYFLAYTDAELAALETLLGATKRMLTERPARPLPGH